MALFVNLYEGNRAYGGPEEGGWWYDTGEPVRSFPCYTDRRATRIARLVQRIADHRNKVERRRPLSSVACDGWYVVRIEDHEARAFPERRPTYE